MSKNKEASSSNVKFSPKLFIAKLMILAEQGESVNLSMIMRNFSLSSHDAGLLLEEFKAQNFHLIKKYENRKLYDMTSSKYVTLYDIECMVRDGVKFKVCRNGDNLDVTADVLLNIMLSQQLKSRAYSGLTSELKEAIKKIAIEDSKITA